METGNAMWEEVEKQTGTATQNVTAGTVRSASLKQMVHRSRAGLFSGRSGSCQADCGHGICFWHGDGIKGRKNKNAVQSD